LIRYADNFNVYISTNINGVFYYEAEGQCKISKLKNIPYGD